MSCTGEEAFLHGFSVQGELSVTSHHGTTSQEQPDDDSSSPFEGVWPLDVLVGCAERAKPRQVQIPAWGEIQRRHGKTPHHHHLFQVEYSLIQAAMQYNCGRRLHGVWHHSDPIEQEDWKQEPAPDACEQRDLFQSDLNDIVYIHVCHDRLSGYGLQAISLPCTSALA